MSNTRNTPVINTDDNFVPFLEYLVREEGYEAIHLIGVVEKPWHYKTEYAEFLFKHYFDIKNLCDLEFDDIDMADAYDFCDAHLSAATYVYPDKTTKDLTEEELEWVQDNNEDWFQEELYSYLH